MVYEDPAYPLSVHLLSPIKGANLNQQKDFNSAVRSVCEAVEGALAMF